MKGKKLITRQSELIKVTADSTYSIISVFGIVVCIYLMICGIKMIDGHSWRIVEIVVGSGLYVGVLFIGLGFTYWLINLGRRIELSKTGCKISFLFIKQNYSWDRYVVKKVEKYYKRKSYEKSTPYEEGVVFSMVPIKRSKKYRPENIKIIWNRTVFSTVWICFLNEKSKEKNWNQFPLYQVDREEFLQKMEEWGVELEQAE